MFFSRVSLSEDYGNIRELYLSAFPEQERIPFDVLASTVGRGGNLVTYLSDGAFKGFSFTYSDGARSFLVYLAFNPGDRGKGFGSEALADIRKRFGRDTFTVMEKPESGFTSAELCKGRKRFYERNGCTVPGVTLLSDGYLFDAVWLGAPVPQADMESTVSGYEAVQKSTGGAVTIAAVSPGTPAADAAEKMYSASYSGMRKVPFGAFLSNGTVMLIEVSGEPAGYCASVSAGGVLLVPYMAVEERFRGRGVFSEALRLLRSEHPDETMILLPEAPGVGERLQSTRYRLLKRLSALGFEDMMERYTLLGRDYQIVSDGKAGKDDAERCLQHLKRRRKAIRMPEFIPAGADSPYRGRIEALNDEAFPEPERTSYDDMLLAEKAGCGGLYAVLEDGSFAGFTYLLWQEEILYIYYLAVEPALRGRGCGSRIIGALAELYPRHIMALSAETPPDRSDSGDIRSRRIAFYERNGFVDDRRPIPWRGIPFDMMYRGGRIPDERMKKFFDETEKARKAARGGLAGASSSSGSS